jgi:hypothetical protein
MPGVLVRPGNRSRSPRVGPAVLDRIHVPALAVRLLWVVPLAAGIPLLAVWASSRSRQPTDPSRGRVVGAALLGSFGGAIALAATLSATTIVAELLGASHPLNVAYALLGWLVGAGPEVHATSLLLYIALLLLLACISAAYYEFVLPYLALLTLGVFAIIFSSAALLRRDDSFDLWWQTGGPIVVLGVVCGVAVYALTAVHGRALAVAVAPAFRL